MPPIPEFILKRLYVKNSLKHSPEGFSFRLNNTFSPATIKAFNLLVNNELIDPARVRVEVEGQAERSAQSIDVRDPLSLSLGAAVTIRSDEKLPEGGSLQVRFDTVDAGELMFGIDAAEKKDFRETLRKNPILDFILGPLKVNATIEYDKVIGEINPYVYGHFVEHLEDGVYGGIWTKDGAHWREDVVGLIKDLRPSIIRYPGGNFASDYHWEDGIGPKSERPQRENKGWNAIESNQVGTDEFLQFCEHVGAQAFLVVNDANGTPEEAARWVAYCNEPATGEQGKRRAANGHKEPYNVKKWGIGNEVWGQWQVGHTNARAYAARLREFAQAMRAVDPEIQIVAVGQQVDHDIVTDPGRLWNEAVLAEAGDLIDELSFHLYQPSEEGWQEGYDQDVLFKTLTAAPLDVQEYIQRVARQVARNPHRRKVTVALDEWNLWLPTEGEVSSRHKVTYRMRDALYAAGILNVFGREGKSLTTANLAQLVNVLPLIQATEDRAITTPLYHVFKLFSQMEKIALEPVVKGPKFNSASLGNISTHSEVPYLDIGAARSRNGQRLTLMLVNRHPSRRMYLDINLKGFGLMQAVQGWLISNKDPLAYNTPENPRAVTAKELKMPDALKTKFRLDLHESAVALMVLRKGS